MVSFHGAFAREHGMVIFIILIKRNDENGYEIAKEKAILFKSNEIIY